jgi:peptide/nickel transport system permease protein
VRALLLRRFGSFAITLLIASLLIFVVLDLLPGNAAAILLGTSALAAWVPARRAASADPMRALREE